MVYCIVAKMKYHFNCLEKSKPNANADNLFCSLDCKHYTFKSLTTVKKLDRVFFQLVYSDFLT